MKPDTNNEVARLISHEGNTDAKFKQLHEVASCIVEYYIEDPDRRSYYRSQIQQLTPTTEETSKKDTSTETCPSQKDNEWRELGPDELICEGDECRFTGEPQHEPVMDSMIGGDSELFKFYRFRTRRPLPKQEEPYHWLDSCTCEKCKPQQE